MKFTNSNTENLNSKEKTKNVPKTHVESPEELLQHLEGTKKLIEKELGELDKKIAKLPEGSEKRSQKDIEYNLLNLKYQTIMSELELIKDKRQDVEIAISDHIEAWGQAAQSERA